jgi:hypothetical protein
MQDAGGLVGAGDAACAIILPAEMLTDLPAEQE